MQLLNALNLEVVGELSLEWLQLAGCTSEESRQFSETRARLGCSGGNRLARVTRHGRPL